MTRTRAVEYRRPFCNPEDLALWSWSGAWSTGSRIL